MSYQEELLKMAGEQGHSVKIISSILNAINSHPDLIALPRIAYELIQASHAASLNEPIYFHDCDHQAWRESCEWIVSLSKAPSISRRLGDKFWPEANGSSNNPVKNHGVTRYGFPYSTLWYSAKGLENPVEYYRLLAQVMAASKKLRPDELSVQRHKTFKSLEKIISTGKASIPCEIRVWGSNENFIADCKRFSPAKSSADSAAYFADICRLVRYCHGEVPSTRSRGYGSHRGKRSISPGPEQPHLITDVPNGFVLDDPDDPDQLPGYYDIIVEQTDTADGDLAPDEMSPSTEVWVLDDTASERPYVADLLSQQAIEAHIVRSRQLLPFSYNQFTLLEMRDLLFGASDLFHACRQELSRAQDTSRLQLRMEAILMLHISLWLGQPTRQVVQLSVVDSAMENIDGLVLVKGVPAQFSMIVRRPDLAGDDRWQPTAGIRPALLRVLLPDLAGSSALVDALLQAFPRSSNQVFTSQTAELEAEVKAVLHMLGEGDQRFTLTKLQNYLFRQLVSDTHDVAAASMLSGVTLPSARTPRYYLQLDANYLRQIYVDSLERVLQQVYACAGLAYAPVELKQVQHGALGATHCLLAETIAANVSAMAEFLRKKPTGRLSEMLAWHNCYTLWTVQMFMLTTGCRAIRNPLLSVEEFDPALSMGAMSDKDADDRHMSRLVCMPAMLKRQIEHYFLHCESLNRQLIGYLPQDDEIDRWSCGFFLSISATGLRRDEIAPKAIFQQMEQVANYLPHRINGYRKFLRTELAERGCPAEPLGAFMGHWLRGEEPQDAYSSFCPATYTRVLDEWITPLLKELGWSALASPWVAE